LNREDVAQSFQWHQPIDLDNRLHDGSNGTALLRCKASEHAKPQNANRYK
jgi:hypothetical protein